MKETYKAEKPWTEEDLLLNKLKDEVGEMSEVSLLKKEEIEKVLSGAQESELIDLVNDKKTPLVKKLLKIDAEKISDLQPEQRRFVDDLMMRYRPDLFSSKNSSPIRMCYIKNILANKKKDDFEKWIFSRVYSYNLQIKDCYNSNSEKMIVKDNQGAVVGLYLAYAPNATSPYVLNLIGQFKSLKELNLYGCVADDSPEGVDISPLKNLKCLTKLNLCAVIHIKDISPLKNLIALKDLNISCNKIEKIIALKNLFNLEKLVINSNKIKNYGPLKNLKNLKLLVSDAKST